MTRRPVCLACLLLMAAMLLADGLGFPLIRGNPLPSSVQEWISRYPQAVVCGETVRCARTEGGRYFRSCHRKGSAGI